MDNEELPDRDTDLSTRKDIQEIVLDTYRDVRRGFEDQVERADDAEDYWDAYNCVLNNSQFYMGNSRIYVPIIHDAVTARKTRFVNQLFPRSGQFIDCTSEDATEPYAIMALAEHYVRKSGLRLLLPPLCINGDIEGHYHIYIEWGGRTRNITQRVDQPTQGPDGMQDPDEKHEDIEVDIPLRDEFPIVEILADNDVLVLPATATNLEDALEQGGSISIVRRWTKAMVKKKIASGDINAKAGKQILADLSRDPHNLPQKEQAKQILEEAGVRKDGRGKWVQVYEIWHKLPVGADDTMLLCRTYMVGEKKIGSTKRNPLWCDRLPIISQAVQKMAGSFKGVPPVKPTCTIQYFANDTINEAADASAFAMLPIIMTDPEKNPRIGSMVLALGAIWQTDPGSTQFAKFPELWKDGLEIVGACRDQIFQTLSVNASQIPQQSNKRSGAGKRNQAEVANEQMVDVLTTADAVTVLEEGVLTPAITLFMEMDYQYRDKKISVARYGSLGKESAMQEIPPLQMGSRYKFTWLGVEAARNTQMMQQQISAINMIRGIPPQAYQGYQLDIAPAIVNMLQSIFGPRLAPRIFKDIRYTLSSDPNEENQELLSGVSLPVHPLDDHQAHLQVHMKIAAMDAHGNVKVHILQHQEAMAAAKAAQAEQMRPKGQQGAPGGAGPGVPGAPKPGAQPGQARPAQRPPGAINQDRMPLAMPRPKY